jgi:2',3'-cyclic-nucleotide 2'-phosphodiesterase
MKVLFIGDVVGRLGRAAVREMAPRLRKEYGVDTIILNGENSAAGVGITKKICEEYHTYGIDVITSGNHIWDKKEILHNMDDCPCLIRPANYPEGVPGVGFRTYATKDNVKFTVANLIGRVFMPAVDDPFRCADGIIEKVKTESPIILIDFHGEATSEKNALGWYLNGRISALIGTHTHVQTSDERILPGGTAYITDVGMVGARDSVIGVKKEAIIKRFLTSLPERFEPELEGQAIFNALLIDIDNKTGKAKEVKRIFEVLEGLKLTD